MKGKLIVIEAGDGSGKETQTRKLYERLQQEQYAVKKITFPDYESDSSALIKMYLSGKFGDNPNDVNPYVASTFYAVDRFASFKTDWGSVYEAGGIIIADRYTTSNMVHQAVKFADEQAKRQYLDWLWDLEFGKFGLPVPDCVIFLDMPPTYASRLIKARADKAGVCHKDIHERNEEYLRSCYSSYTLLSERLGWIKVPCVERDAVRSMEAIHQDVYNVVQQYI